MKTNKAHFYNSIDNPERVFLLKKELNELSLIADMEIVDENVSASTIRTERMDFLLDAESDFMYDVVECRARYCGGIYIYNNANKSAEDIYFEFVSADERIDNLSYHIIDNDKVKNICNRLEEGYNYVIIN